MMLMKLWFDASHVRGIVQRFILRENRTLGKRIVRSLAVIEE